MALLVALVAVGVTLLIMPEVFGDLLAAAVENPGFGIGLLALLVLVGVWIDRR